MALAKDGASLLFYSAESATLNMIASIPAQDTYL